MICRDILEHPERAAKFDYFNDYRNTLGWLHIMESRPDTAKKAEKAIHALNEGHQNWLKGRQEQ